MFNLIAVLLAVDVFILAVTGLSLWMAHLIKAVRVTVNFVGYTHIKTTHKIAGLVLLILILIHVSF